MDDEIPLQGGSHASSSHEVSLEPTSTRREDLGKHNVHTHFPKDRNCEICQRTKITRGPCRRRKGEAVLRAEKFWWLDNSRSQGPNRQFRISKQSSICSRGAGSSHSMDPGVSVQKTTSQEPQRSLQKFQEPDRKIKSHLHWQILAIRQSLWRSFLESLHVYTTSIGDQRYCGKSSAQSKGRHLCCIVAIWSEWKLVGRFYGMLHLSAKRHRFIIWWEDALWKSFWATI